MHLRLVAAHGAGPRPHVVGDDPVCALGAALGGGVGDQVLGLGGKADDEARTLGAGSCDRGEDVRVLGKLQRRLAALVLLLELVGRLVGCAPIGDGSGADGDVGGKRLERRGKHLMRRLDLDHAHAFRIRQRHRAADQNDLGAERRAARASAWPCLPDERLAM